MENKNHRKEDAEKKILGFFILSSPVSSVVKILVRLNGASVAEKYLVELKVKPQVFTAF